MSLMSLESAAVGAEDCMFENYLVLSSILVDVVQPFQISLQLS